MNCPSCKAAVGNKATCPKCGEPMSVDSATIENLVQAASIPNLASLMKRAKEAGLIAPVVQYGPTEVKP